MSAAANLANFGTFSAIVAAAAVLCALFIVALKPLLQRYALARPNARSSHREPTPQGGGIAVCAAALGVVAAVALLVPSWDIAPLSDLGPLLGAVVLMALVG